MNTALNRTSVALLTNKSGGSVAQGDVVIVDSANAAAFTTTTTSGYVSGLIGVVLEPNGIASNATGTVALGGYVPIVNLSSSASLGDVFKTHSVAKQAVRHAAPVVAGDFGQVLGTGTTPAALLGELPVQSGSGTSLTSSNASLSADVTATTANTFYDGPTLPLSSGTWLVTANLSFLGVVGSTASYTAQLYDGSTNHYDSSQLTLASGGFVGTLPLNAIIVLGSTTTIHAALAGTVGGAVLKAAANNNGVGNNASTMTAIKIG